MLADSVVVDLTRGFSTYESTGASTAVVGGGMRLGPLYYKAWTDSGLAFPGGTCPGVGIGGLLLGALVSTVSRRTGSVR